MSSDIIITIKSPAETKFREKGSLFIGQTYQVSEIEEAENIILQTKKKYFDATHNCYAFLLFNGVQKYSDDGEPSGTAGIRLLNAIQHFGLVNVLLISTRYFGGTKLGVGPLAKAYYKSGIDTLEIAPLQKQGVYVKFLLEFDQSMISTVYHFLSSYEANILLSDFKEYYTIECLILKDRKDEFIKAIEKKLYHKTIIKAQNGEFLRNIGT
ncbi:MAG: YigZ family protein [Ignavibacteria bacterium]|nr:YigZ family protein [Ignavibacteria bacterium]